MRHDASSSLNSRTFSIAITAWSEKVFRSPMSLSLNSPGSARPTVITPMVWFSRNIGTMTIERNPRSRDATRPIPGLARGSVSMSATFTTARSTIARPISDDVSAGRGN
jgi:hypothetical protein